MDDVCLMMWEEIMWPIVKYDFGIYMGDLKETMNFLIQDSVVTEWD